jgi:hypothetical protein
MTKISLLPRSQLPRLFAKANLRLSGDQNREDVVAHVVHELPPPAAVGIHHVERFAGDEGDFSPLGDQKAQGQGPRVNCFQFRDTS